MDESFDVVSRLTALEAQYSEILERLSRVETKLAEVASAATSDQNLRRFVETKTGRAGEMSSRIAQRLAKCEAAIELLARVDSETMDHA